MPSSPSVSPDHCSLPEVHPPSFSEALFENVEVADEKGRDHKVVFVQRAKWKGNLLAMFCKETQHDLSKSLQKSGFFSVHVQLPKV